VRFHGQRSTSVIAKGPKTAAGRIPQKVMSAMCLVVLVDCEMAMMKLSKAIWWIRSPSAPVICASRRRT
jgi:hypothetical protein